MANNPMAITDPDGDFIIPILIGAAIGAAISGGTTMVMNAVAGNNIWDGFGRAVAFGAVGGAIGAGIGTAFAGTAFGQSTSFGVLNNFASSAATNSIFGNDLTLGSFVGSFAGGLVRGHLPAYQGVAGGSLVNGVGEILHMGATGAVTGAVGGSIGALVDGKSIKSGFINGSLQGALGGATQAGLNIALMGTTYLPDQSYGDFGDFEPVYRRGTFITRALGPDTGIAIGRNLVTNENKEKGVYPYLRAHETKHFIQQRSLGFGGFYTRILKEYISPGYWNSMRFPGYLEYEAHQYGLRFGYPR